MSKCSSKTLINLTIHLLFICLLKAEYGSRRTKYSKRIYLPAYIAIYLYVRPSFCSSVSLFLCLSVHHVFLSVNLSFVCLSVRSSIEIRIRCNKYLRYFLLTSLIYTLFLLFILIIIFYPAKH